MPTPEHDSKPLTIVVRAPGTNCDRELVRAFELAGSLVRSVHIDALARDPAMLREAGIVAFPGGFSYGDDIASGRVFAAKCAGPIHDELRAAIDRGGLLFGVCNGFQVLARLGLLPGWTDEPGQVVSLSPNAIGGYRDDWATLETAPDSPCVWTRGMPERFDCPFAHAEGRVVTRDEGVLDRLESEGLVALRYAEGENPNGSARDIAGLTDPTGRVLGLMPHPERAVVPTDLPAWTRDRDDLPPPSLRLFENAVEAARGAVGAV